MIGSHAAVAIPRAATSPLRRREEGAPVPDGFFRAATEQFSRRSSSRICWDRHSVLQNALSPLYSKRIKQQVNLLHHRLKEMQSSTCFSHIHLQLTILESKDKAGRDLHTCTCRCLCHRQDAFCRSSTRPGNELLQLLMLLHQARHEPGH